MQSCRQLWSMVFLCCLGSFWCSTAWGHSDLDPRQSLPNKWETYTLRVPTEPASPTVQIRLTVPAEFEVEMIEHTPAWQVATTRSERGFIQSITWSGSTIPPQTFQDFKILTRNATAPGLYIWKIEQSYGNGEAGSWEAQTQIIALGATGTQRAEEAFKAAQVATTVSLVAVGIAITLILVTLIHILQRRSSAADGEQ